MLKPQHHDVVSALAYELWLQRGCPLGSPELDWFSAEEVVKQRNVVPRSSESRTLPVALRELAAAEVEKAERYD